MPFALLLGIRSHLESRQRALTALTVFAIATSVALAAGLEMAIRSVEAELERTANVLAGVAQIEVTGGSLGVRENLLERVSEVPGVLYAAPVLEGTLRLRGGPKAGTALHLLGVDLLADPDVRAYRFNQDAFKERDVLRLAMGGNSVVITQSLARDLGVGLRDELPLWLYDEPIDLSVQAILADGGIADAYGGQIVVMDAFVMQTLLGREGWLDRIDVVVDSTLSVDAIYDALRRAVGGRATVRPAALRDAWVQSTIGAIRLIIWSLLAVGVLVASLVSYATLSLSVDRRIRDFAVLRSAGLEARKVRRLVRIDAGVLTLVGSAVGLALGIGLSRSFASILSGVSTYLQGVEIQQLQITPLTVLIALTVGSAVGILGSIEPAYRASAHAPLDVLRARQSPLVTQRRHWLTSWTTYTILGLAWLSLVFAPPSVSPFIRLPVIFMLGLLLIGLLARDAFPKVVLLLRPWLERAVTRVGRLCGASLLARPAHTGMTVATLGGVVAGITVTLVMIGSLSATLDEWTSSQYPGGIFIAAGNPLGGKDREELTPEVVEIIRTTPGVRATFDHYTSSILYRGEEVLIAGSSMGAMADHGRLPMVQGAPREVALALAAGDIAVSDQFQSRFRVGVGDIVQLNTPRGLRDFRVAGVMRDYAGPAGSLNLDIEVFDSLWPRAGSSNLVIWVDGPLPPVIDEIRRRAGSQQDLFFIYGEKLERYASAVIGQFTTILDVVAYLTGVLGGIAVMNLLLAAVLDRRRELALLRSTGATGAQLMTIVLVDGVLLSAAGAVAGIALGLACAYPMVTQVVRSAFSWWIDFRVDPSQITGLGLVVVAAALVAALYPALQTRRLHPREALAPE